MTDKASIRPDMDPELRTKAIAAAWSAWQSRHGGKLGPGPAFTEAIDAVLGVVSHAFIEKMAALEAENAKLARLLADPCVQKLEPDEPFFVLLGRDPDAAQAIARWVKLREGREGISDKTDAALKTFHEFGDFRRARTTLQEHAEDGERQGDKG
jgi:hypothetical protein